MRGEYSSALDYRRGTGNDEASRIGSPTKRTFEMIRFYMTGWVSLDELERHIEKLQPTIL
jgi:hypothetical protein